MLRLLFICKKNLGTEIKMHMYFIFNTLPILRNIHSAQKIYKSVVTTNLNLCNTVMAQLARLSDVSFDCNRAAGLCSVVGARTKNGIFRSSFSWPSFHHGRCVYLEMSNIIFQTYKPAMT